MDVIRRRKKLVKTHTFTDLMSRYLVDSCWVHPERLIAEGRSAGDLHGAVTARSFWVVIAGVPSRRRIIDLWTPPPLTVGESGKSGNPIEDPEVYAPWQCSYTPYVECPPVRHPAIMATTPIIDASVFYVEPHKWVQRLRQATAQVPDQPPIVIRTEMSALLTRGGIWTQGTLECQGTRIPPSSCTRSRYINK